MAEHADRESDDIDALLTLRGRVLAPGPAMVDRVLKRCGLRSTSDSSVAAADQEFDEVDSDEYLVGDRQEVGEAGTKPFVPDQLSQRLGVFGDREDVPSEHEDEASPGSAEGLAVDSEVARAHTVPEESPPASEPASNPVQRSGAHRRKRKKGRVLPPGTLIKGYRIVGLLGKGGMGHVYRAVQLSMNREVAFKVLSSRFAGSKSFRRRFIREARSAGRLHHPNLISVHDVDEEGGLLFFSMELVPGSSIGERLDDKRIYGPLEALHIVRQALRALHYAHNNGIVHRDIKPDNLMQTQDGVVKVADMGLALVEQDSGNASETHESGVTVAGTMMGTPYYMAPEQGRDAHSVDHRADLYSLGASLYHMVVGDVPFRGETAVDVVVNATTKPLVFPPEADLPRPLCQVIERLMAKDPEERPATAQEGQRLVDGAIAILEGRRSGSISAAAKPVAAQRKWGIAIAIGVLLVAVILLWMAGASDRAARAARADVRALIEDQRFPAALQRLQRLVRLHPSLDAEAQAARERVLEEWDVASRAALEQDFAQLHAELLEEDIAAARSALRTIESQEQWASPWTGKRIEEAREQIDKAEILRDALEIMGGALGDAGLRPNLLASRFDYRRRGVQPEAIGDALVYRLQGEGVHAGIEETALRLGESYELLISVEMQGRSNFKWGLLWGERASGNRSFIGVMAGPEMGRPVIAALDERQGGAERGHLGVVPESGRIGLILTRVEEGLQVALRSDPERTVLVSAAADAAPRIEWFLGMEGEGVVRARMQTAGQPSE